MAVNFLNPLPGSGGNFFRRRVPFFMALGIMIVSAVLAAWIVQKESKEIKTENPAAIIPLPKKISQLEKPEKPPEKKFIPVNFSMETIKKKGCVADGMLSEYGGNTKEMIKLIEKSQCQYLHRALETWLDEPDFEKATEIMAEIDKPGIVFGMFIAEAIDKNKDYEDPVSGKNYDYDEMCRQNTTNTWTEGDCIPSMEKKEYRKYVKSITERAMDIGIQSFLFGQIHFQDAEYGNYSDSELPDVIKDMRNYAKKKKLQIIIGAQTNAITDEKYLRLFDYIEGGVGIDSQGNIEDGSCWSQKQSCWALLWHDNFRTKAKNVILNLDWSGMENDDMSKFARMDRPTRIKTLDNLYSYFTSRNMGFMMPFLAPIYEDKGGCYGPKKRFYSPDNRYKCKDEDAINEILSGG